MQQQKEHSNLVFEQFIEFFLLNSFFNDFEIVNAGQWPLKIEVILSMKTEIGCSIPF